MAAVKTLYTTEVAPKISEPKPFREGTVFLAGEGWGLRGEGHQ